jgi:hypothetical protein
MILNNVERDIFRDNLHRDGIRKALGVLWWNLRFEVGYAIGGFTNAKR